MTETPHAVARIRKRTIGAMSRQPWPLSRRTPPSRTMVIEYHGRDDDPRLAVPGIDAVHLHPDTHGRERHRREHLALDDHLEATSRAASSTLATASPLAADSRP